MKGPARNDYFTTTVDWCTVHFYCSNLWRPKIWPLPPILLTTLMLSLEISSCFQECNCSYGFVVSSMSLKFGNNRLPTSTPPMTLSSSGTGRNIEPIVLIWCDFDRASSLICGNKMPSRCNRGFLLQI